MYKPKIILGKLKTNKPIEVLQEWYKGQSLTAADFENVLEANKIFDGLELYLSLWAHDKHSSYHLSNWDNSIDEKIMLAMYHLEQTSPFPMYLDEKERFIEDWESGNYEPACAFTFDLEDVEVIKVIQEEIEDGKVQHTSSK